MRKYLLAMLLLCTTFAWAYPKLADCQITKNYAEDNWAKAASWSVCVSFLQGMVVTDVAHRELGARPFMGCSPEKASGEQLRLVLMKYVDEHPEQLHYQFWLLAAHAFREAWTCKQ